MRFKRLLALLLAAALALSLLAGCGGGQQSVSRVLLNLLDGQYQNVSVEIDSDLEAKLRQAISESETDEELRAALEQLLGGGISFQRLGSGQQGDSAWTLIIYPGTDPNAAARSVYLDLDKVFAALPDDGVYSSGFAMAEMENGYAILVRATVDKAGTEDKPDPVTLTGISVSGCKTEYFVGQSFDPTGMTVTATYSDNSTKTITGITETDKKNVSWTPETLDTAGKQTVTISYGGKTTTVSVTVEEPEVKEIKVTAPTTTSYTAGQFFDSTGLKVTASYTYGSDQQISISECDLTLTLPDNSTATVGESYKFEKAGDYTLTVSYEGVKAEIPLTVNFGTVARITVSGDYKKEYELNETFDSTGLKVTAYDSYNNSKPVTSYTITDQEGKTVGDSYTFEIAGTYTLTVSYNNMEATVEITVNPATVTGIEVTQDPTKMTYISGEPFDRAGMTITATYSDGTKTAVNDYTCSPETVTKDNTKVTITYGELETTVTVQILDGDNSYDAKTNTYSIATADGLMAWNEATRKDLSINCTLTANIDLTGENWMPIDKYGYSGGYQGVLDGQGHRITGLATTTDGTMTYEAVALFGCIGGNGEVKNLQLDVAFHVIKYGLTSSIAVSNHGKITACSATGTIKSANSGVGGIAWTNYGTITACWFNGTLSGQDMAGYTQIGGIGWENDGGTITACYWGGNALLGLFSGTGETTKVDDDESWQTAVDGMNAALAGNNYKWTLGNDGLPTLT